MEVRELRIGNIVRWGDHWTSVDINMLRDIDVYNQGGICGEPINEDWLVKFDFYKGWGKELRIEITKESSMSYSDGIFYIGDGLELNNIKYVHQLQNLYFALTGQELTIKP